MLANSWREWGGFAAGFLAVYLAIALFWPMPFYDGQFVRRTVLWQYYLLEMQRLVGSSGSLGPGSGNPYFPGGIAVAHLLLALLGGAVGAWIARVQAS
ncbi:MAG: hypothetical protein ACK6DS_00695 [Planctomycetota bacterium]